MLFLTIDDKNYAFYVEKRIRKNDIWKIYYLIYRKKPAQQLQSQNPTIIRLDSGCVSGQIYDDLSCDCLDQLHTALKTIIQKKENNSIIIHIPCHDGRGFGTAPKAETEIYKQGMEGRVYNTQEKLDTIQAAELLYGKNNIYDIRFFDEAALILRDLNIKNIKLLTDNVLKVNTFKKYDINVIRKKTKTDKQSCIEHIDAKKRSNLYFSE